MATWFEDLCTFKIIPRRILLRMSNFSDKIYKENQNTELMFNNFFSGNSAVYENMQQNIVDPDRPQMTMW